MEEYYDADDALMGAYPVAPTADEAPEPVSAPEAPEADESASSEVEVREDEAEGKSVSPLLEPPREFDERFKDPFKGLLYLGYLTSEFQIFGHDFKIATPSQMEKLELGNVMRNYKDAITSEIAWQTVYVAMFLVSIDGEELPQPVLTKPKDSALQDRFNWVAMNLRQPVIDRLFTHCLELEQEVQDILEAMGEA